MFNGSPLFLKKRKKIKQTKESTRIFYLFLLAFAEIRSDPTPAFNSIKHTQKFDDICSLLYIYKCLTYSKSQNRRLGKIDRK